MLGAVVGAVPDTLGGHAVSSRCSRRGLYGAILFVNVASPQGCILVGSQVLTPTATRDPTRPPPLLASATGQVPSCAATKVASQVDDHQDFKSMGIVYQPVVLQLAAVATQETCHAFESARDSKAHATYPVIGYPMTVTLVAGGAVPMLFVAPTTQQIAAPRPKLWWQQNPIQQ